MGHAYYQGHFTCIRSEESAVWPGFTADSGDYLNRIWIKRTPADLTAAVALPNADSPVPVYLTILE
ncbi:hypothetical protein C0039_06000 [Pseudohalioglobus lutimaris]|uniref:Uncharacterized protein n=2 Tax=Pseudohalioglobus lutimaris TaxID=1737061 RepID=A0A2N5X506_9GAMM|nr:hypothetical protein C0039_06000 [Pseudohalioglobus lutimaris]